MLAITVQNLSKQFKRRVRQGFLRDMIRPQFDTVVAVNGISFSIKAGESVAFLGPNGAGKTTTVKMLTGLIYPSAGEISVLGFDPSKRDPDLLRNIGLVMGNKQGLNWDLTAEQSFDLLRQIYRIDKVDFAERLDYLTELLDVRRLLNTQVRKLSLGERMKMELIGAIIHSPKILFLDEPTIGLDIIAKQNIRAFLREIQQKMKVTLLLTSHDMDDIESVSDRVIVINKGQKVYDASLQSLTAEYSDNRYVKVTFNNMKESKKVSALQAEVVGKKAGTLTYKVPRSQIASFLAKLGELDVDDIDIISVPLEEMIKNIFESSKP